MTEPEDIARVSDPCPGWSRVPADPDQPDRTGIRAAVIILVLFVVAAVLMLGGAPE